MLLCLSSSARRRYIEDIYRCLSMPKGLYIQFRYTKDYIPHTNFEGLKKNEYINERVLVCFLDRVDQNIEPTAVPCRYGTIVNSSAVGDICTIVFRLDEYAYTDSLEQSNKELRGIFSNFPEWDRTGDEPEVAGCFCGQLSSVPNSIGITNKEDIDERWLQVIKQVHSSFQKMKPEYEYASHFYRVEGIFKTSKYINKDSESNLLHPNKEGTYELDSNQDYVLSLVHKAEENDRLLGIAKTIPKIKINSTETISWFSRHEIVLDSPYDRAQMRFKAPNYTITKNVLLDFERHITNNENDVIFDFVMPVKINSNINALMFNIVAVTLLLSTQYILKMFDSSLGDKSSMLIGVLASLALACIVVLRLPKL